MCVTAEAQPSVLVPLTQSLHPCGTPGEVHLMQSVLIFLVALAVMLVGIHTLTCVPRYM